MASDFPQPTPKGPLSIGQRKLAELVAECPSFQEMVGVGGQQDALASVYLPWLANTTDLDVIDRPVAVITIRRFRTKKIDAWSLTLDELRLGLLLFMPDPHPGHAEWSELEFSNWLGAIVQELADRQARDARLAIASIDLLEGPQMNPLKTVGQRTPYWYACLEIACGKSEG